MVVEMPFVAPKMKIGIRLSDTSITKNHAMNENTEKKELLNNNKLTEITIAPSERVKSRKKGVLAYPQNPFWKPYEVDIGKKKVTIDSGYVTKNETGETQHIAGIHRVEEVDEERFIKLFTQNMHVFFDLSPASQKLLQCVLSLVQDKPRCLGINLDWIDMEDYAKKFSFKTSRTSYHRALHEMISKGFLAESERSGYFWINVHLFFNGDRMVFITEYRKKHTKAIKSDGEKREELEKNGQLRLGNEYPTPNAT